MEERRKKFKFKIINAIGVVGAVLDGCSLGRRVDVWKKIVKDL